MTKDTVTVIQTNYFDTRGDLKNRADLLAATDTALIRNAQGRKIAWPTAWQRMIHLQWTVASTVEVEIPIASIKRRRFPTTYEPDTRNKAGVGKLHRSRISCKVVPLEARLCGPDGTFEQEW